MSHFGEFNVLLVKVGTEPGLESIVKILKEFVPTVRTFGVVGSRGQTSFLDEIVTTSDEAMLASHEEYFSHSLYVSPELYQRVVADEGKLLRMLERVAIHDLTKVNHPRFPIPEFRDSTDDRSQLLLRQLAYWDHALRSRRINAVVAQNYGHNGWDAVVQVVARALDIPYLYFHEVRPFLGSLYVHEQTKDIGSLELGKNLIENARRMYGLVDESSNRESRLLQQAGLIPEAPSGASSQGSQSIFARLLVRVGSPSDLPRRLTRSVRRRIRTMRSMRDERSAVKASPLPPNYIFCELQSQPNATTAVKGWMFPDQRESLALVAKHLPSGWSLVVKESDRQWSRMYPRRRNYWSQIAAIANVQVIGHQESSKELVRHAQAVLETSYSSVAFSALGAGKPVLVLGYTHLCGLPGVFHALSESEVMRALVMIAEQPLTVVDQTIRRDTFFEFVKMTREATIEGSMSSMPEFTNVAEREAYVERVTHNTAAVIAAWLERIGSINRSS